MIVRIPLLSRERAHAMRDDLAGATWADGRRTAGHQSAQAKHNDQVVEGDPVAVRAGEQILGALEQNALFISAALPAKVFPPLFNRYAGGQTFGGHVDNAIRQVPNSAHRVRTDLSATLFLSDPDEYDGGELVIAGASGSQSAKLAAGELLLYPATSVHHVNPVTRGARVASFFWMQSMVRSQEQRTLLFELDDAIRRVRDADGDRDGLVGLVGVYHNLVRRWADC